MADAGETVTVEFGVHKTKALANASGEWKTELEARPLPSLVPLRLEPVQKILFARMWLSVWLSASKRTIKYAMES